MDGLRFIRLKKEVQHIIDLMGGNNFEEAQLKLTEAAALLDEILDHSSVDEDVLEAGHYQALLNQLQERLNR
jgi:3-keto-L-gulonate-6-phosphate decarboxylase